MTVLLPSAELARHAAATMFAGATSAASGIELTGNGVATALLTAATVTAVVLTVWNGNRKTRREVAKDNALSRRKAWRRGSKATDAQWRTWLNFNLANGALELRPGVSAMPTPPPSADDEDEDADDD